MKTNETLEMRYGARTRPSGGVYLACDQSNLQMLRVEF
jgi:hypothetical protein